MWLDTTGAVVAERRGVYIAAGAHLWEWVNGRKRVKGLDCTCYNRTDDPAGCMTTEPVRTAYLRDLTGGSPRVWVMEAEDSDDMAPPPQSADPMAGAGPYLFVRGVGEFDGCGAHDLPGSWRMVMDLSRGDTIAVADTAGVFRRNGEKAVAAFAQIAEFGDDEADSPGPGTLDGLEFQWTRVGRLQSGYRFYVGACFACSDEYMSYGRTALVADSVMPRWLRPWSSAPRPVRAYWRADTRLRAGWRKVKEWNGLSAYESSPWYYSSGALRTGWSAVDPAHAAEMLERFAPVAVPAASAAHRAVEPVSPNSTTSDSVP
ncbi:MAG TPA: hypothetical protein VFJ82_06615 [Longimicrobium sp.]|nr:hypothetical protein [Longimicrobium sp.]